MDSREAIAALKDGERPAIAVATAAPKIAGSSETVEEIADVYTDMLDSRVEAKQLTSGTVDVDKYRLRKVVGIIGPNLPMHRLDDAKLLETILALCARPLTGHMNRKTPPKQMSIDSVKEYKKSFKAFLTWAASTPMPRTLDRPIWVRPLRFDQHFAHQPTLLDSERKTALQAIEGKAEVTTFSVTHLAVLYGAAETNALKHGQVYLLLGLNCGFANEEIADLSQHEIKLGRDPYIHRFRGKTQKPGNVGVYARWPLWKETAELLAELVQDDPTKPALLTPEGKRLIVGRSDYVRTTWDVVHKRVYEPVRKQTVLPELSFKYLRKTSSTMIQNDLKYGGKIADAFLSHGGRGVMSKYTPQDWDQVGEAVQALRRHLNPMFQHAAAARR